MTHNGLFMKPSHTSGFARAESSSLITSAQPLNAAFFSAVSP